jgi:hypothetical protein
MKTRSAITEAAEAVIIACELEIVDRISVVETWVSCDDFRVR